MPTTRLEASSDDVRVPVTVAKGEAAWLLAITDGDEQQRELTLPGCVIAHGPAGNVHEREHFLACNASTGDTAEAQTSGVTCRERGERAVATCSR
ncbi:hypothetical protein ACFYRY_07040 [Streptomyces sp. NPDC005263]|uniref:hypothetical protein n=1 Tax=Streptomyces sp. NPDC005263 TaxID=3364711 RepID=UPI003695F396